MGTTGLDTNIHVRRIYFCRQQRREHGRTASPIRITPYHLLERHDLTRDPEGKPPQSAGVLHDETDTPAQGKPCYRFCYPPRFANKTKRRQQRASHPGVAPITAPSEIVKSQSRHPFYSSSSLVRKNSGTAVANGWGTKSRRTLRHFLGGKELRPTSEMR